MHITSDGSEFDVIVPSAALIRLLGPQVDQAFYVGTGWEARCDDAEALATSCFLCEVCHRGRGSVDPRGRFRDLTSNSDFCLVAVEGNIAAGRAVKFLGCMFGKREFDGTLLLHDVCVAPAARSRGVGKAMFGEAKRRETRLALQVVKPKTVNETFIKRQQGLWTYYQRLGFRPSTESSAVWRFDLAQPRLGNP